MNRVAVRLQGGLGNQLFQVAAGQALDPDPLLISYGDRWAPGHPDVGDFGLATTYPNRLLRSTVPGITVRESWLDDVSQWTSSFVGWSNGVDQVVQLDPFAPRPSGLRSPASLNGWFQHPWWWHASWMKVAEVLAESAPMTLPDYVEREAVVVKLRMSDYHDDGWVLGRQYFEDALDLLEIANRPVIVMSEDQNATEWFAPLLQVRNCWVVDRPRFTGDVNLDDFWSMVGAAQLIQANSSFSWWAAAVASWLRPEVVVVYPSPWLPNRWSSGEVPDMGLSRWLSLPSHLE